MNPLHPDPQALRLRQEFGQNSKHVPQSQTPSLMITTKKKKKKIVNRLPVNQLTSVIQLILGCDSFK